MSRAYRIEVKEALDIKVSAQDRVESTISMLGLLPQERMESLLTEELIAEGFEPHDCHLEKKTQAADGTVSTVTFDPPNVCELQLTCASWAFHEPVP
jgi:hypothetical protein